MFEGRNTERHPFNSTSGADAASLPPPPMFERAYRGAKEILWALSSAEHMRRFMPEAEALADRIGAASDADGKTISARHIYGAAVSGYVLSKAVGLPLDMQQAIRLTAKTILAVTLIDHVVDERADVSAETKRSLIANLQGAFLRGEEHSGSGQMAVAYALAREVSDELRSRLRFAVFANEIHALAHRGLEQALANSRTLAGAKM